MTAPLPWQLGPWRRAVAARLSARVPHAWLLRGPAASGKSMFADAMARLLLCAAPGSDGPCGACRGCDLSKAGNHPDHLRLGIEPDRHDIRVDVIRETVRQATLTRRLAPYKPIIIEPADALNRSAANALLKTLEEPPEGTVFLLISAHSSTLPATIRSRCQRLDLALPGRQQALEWLAEQDVTDPELAAELLDASDGRPLLARELAGDAGALAQRRALRGELSALMQGRASPVEVARSWSKVEPQRLLDWMLALGNGLVQRCLCEAGGTPQLAALDVRGLYAILDQVVEARRLVAQRATVNMTLLLESLAIAWAGGTQPVRRSNGGS